MDALPKSQDLLRPMMEFLTTQHGPCSNGQIELAVGRKLEIPANLLSIIHSGGRTEFQYRLAWARTNAKSKQWITSPKRESWEITEVGRAEFQFKNP